MLSHRRRDKFSKIAGMNAQIVLSLHPYPSPVSGVSRLIYFNIVVHSNSVLRKLLTGEVL